MRDVSVQEKEFIEAVRKSGLLSPTQLEEALQAQEVMKSQAGVEAPVWQVLVLKGFLSQAQVDGIRQGGPKTFPFGPFRVESKIGEGGMGVVYLAKKENEDRKIALKVLPQRFSDQPEMVKRFEREARISIGLSHPNLIKGYEYGRINGRWFFAMEYVDGKVLLDLIRERKQLEEKRALEIALQVVKALEEIHRAGLVHRDIKPGNIILTRAGVAKVMDLGLIKSSEGDLSVLTQSGHAVGTPHYMSPEQIQGEKKIDIRSDIYSLGATLYHMLTGTKPFSGTTLLEIVNKQLKHELEDPLKYRPDLSEGAIHVIERMMARDRKDRYQTPAEVREDLERVLAGDEPKSERLEAGRSVVLRRVRPSASARASRRFVKEGMRTSRRRVKKRDSTGLLIGAGAVVVLVVVGLVIAGFAGGNGKAPPRPQSAPPAPPPEKPPVEARDPEKERLEEHLKRAREHVEAGRWADAVREANDALAIDPTNRIAEEIVETAGRERDFSAALEAAKEAFASEEWNRARSELARALEAKPGDRTAIEMIGKIKRAEEEQRFEAALARAETNLKAQAWRLAVEACRQALLIRPGEERARATLERVRDEQYGQAMARAKANFDAKEWAKARAAADEALEAKPRDPVATELKKKVEEAARDQIYAEAMARARAHLSAKEWERAREACREALTIKGGDREAEEFLKQIGEARLAEALGRAKAHRKAGELDKALAAVEEALALKPGDSGALGLKKEIEAEVEERRFEDLLERAEKHRKNREWREAVAAASEAVRMRPEDDRAKRLLRRLEREYKRHGYRDAMDRARKHKRAEEWAKAIEAYEEALRIKPGDHAAERGLNELKRRISFEPASLGVVQTVSAHTRPVTGLAFRPDGRVLATAGLDGTVKLWDTKTWKQLQSWAAHGQSSYGVAFSPDGKYLATGGRDKLVKIWDAKTARLVHTLEGHTTYVYSLTFTPDGRRLFTSGGDKVIKVWDPVGGKAIGELSGHAQAIRTIAMGPKGRRLVSGSFDRTVKIWDLSSGSVLRTLTGHTVGPMSVAFSPDGKRVASASSDRTIRIWSADSGEEVHKITVNGHAYGIAFSPDGKILLSGGGQQANLIQMWNVETGKEIRTLTGHTGAVYSFAFHPSLPEFVSCSADMTFKVWGPGGR